MEKSARVRTSPQSVFDPCWLVLPKGHTAELELKEQLCADQHYSICKAGAVCDSFHTLARALGSGCTELGTTVISSMIIDPKVEIRIVGTLIFNVSLCLLLMRSLSLFDLIQNGRLYTAWEPDLPNHAAKLIFPFIKMLFTFRDRCLPTLNVQHHNRLNQHHRPYQSHSRHRCSNDHQA